MTLTVLQNEDAKELKPRITVIGVGGCWRKRG
jgi:cell division GTPase FtsZ